MIFTIITLISLVGLVFALTLHNFNSLEVKNEKDAAGFSLKAYFFWFYKSISGLFKLSWPQRFRDIWKKGIVHPYPGNVRWVFICFYLSFFYLAASGFLFALLFPRRLYGVPLMLHVSAGAVFALCLAIILVLRARSYVVNSEEKKTQEDSDFTRRRIYFWLFMGAGFLLIVTALIMMLPLFSLKVQMDLFEVHRYSALIAVLAAITFAYFSPAHKR